MKNNISFFLLFLLLVSCSKEDDLSLGEEIIQNLAPNNFSVSISEIKYDSAQIQWTESKDPEQGNVTYSLYLNGILIEGNLSERNYVLSDLDELTGYSGEIIATDIEGNETSKSFTFTTEKFYLKFLKRLDYQHSEIGYPGGNPYSLIKADNENYVIAGKTPFGYNGNQFFVMKIDNNGEEIWKKFYPYQAGDAWNFKIIRSKDGYIIAGYYHVMKLNENGEQIWYKKIESYDIDDSSSEIKSLVEYNDGSIYLAGGRGNPHPYNKQLGVLTKLSAQGEILWEKLFDDTYRGFFDDIVVEDNTLMVFGSKETSGVTPEEEAELGYRAENIDFWLLKLDLNGSIIWERTYEDGGYAFPRRIILNKFGGYTLAGYTWTANDFSIGRIIRLDKNAEIIFNIGSDLSSINDICESSDGGIIATGKVDWSPNGEVMGFYKFDIYGNEVWRKQYHESLTKIFGRGVVQSPDDGYLIIGATSKNQYDVGERSQLLVFKTDPQGNYQ